MLSDSAMHGLMAVLANSTDINKIVVDIKDAAAEYLLNPTDKNLSDLEFSMLLFMQKKIVQVKGSVEKTIEDFEIDTKRREMFKTTTN